MQVELKHIKGGLLEQEYTCHPADFPDLAALTATSDASYRGPIDIRLSFRQSARLVEVEGELRATLTIACSRCLATFERELNERLVMTFVPAEEESVTVEERELERNELGMIPYRNDCLELLAPLQEQLVMAVPIRVLCRQECRGLCPECGADKNHTDCDCQRKPFNSKFGVLAKLKK